MGIAPHVIMRFQVPCAILASLVIGCGSSDGDSNANPPPGSTNDAATQPDSPSPNDGGGGGPLIEAGLDGSNSDECTKDEDCDGGFCTGGTCCPTIEQACGDSCCETTETCFASACVIPGDVCLSAADCEEGEYCEPSLGPEPANDAGLGDGGDPDGGDGGPVCLAPPPRAGRCLALPPECPAGQTEMPDGSECMPSCEYHPPVAKLDAVVKWSWGTNAQEFTNHIDVWNTPTVGRLYDTNCDGRVDELDPPNIVFVSGNATHTNGTSGGTCCHCTEAATSRCLTGVLRVLDGGTGQEIWSLRKAEDSSIGFAGTSVALGDLTGDGRLDVAAMTGEGHIAIVDGNGDTLAISTQRVPGYDANAFGWGGGLSLADMDGDGAPEIAFGATVFTFDGTEITRLWVGSGGTAGDSARALSTFVDLDLDTNGHLELLAGSTAYRTDGTTLWDRSAGDLPNGFPAVGDFDADGLPEAVLVASGQVWLLEGNTGETELGPLTLPSDGSGGPPTVADFDGDGQVEIGVAQKEYYVVVKPNYTTQELEVMWQTANHDFSSSVTGSTVFDFEGDGSAEVIYNDECFLWVYDGKTGHVRFATPTTSFTGTEASLVADVDGDGHAEIVMVSNGADPSANGWKCDVSPWNEPFDDDDYGRPAWEAPSGQAAYRGVTVFGDSANSWVGTRTLWNQHTYHVSNICDDRDSACAAPNAYGGIPTAERPNWTVPWLNNFRQNVQDQGIFNAPDAIVSLEADCTAPVKLHAYLRNFGLAILPAGVEVGFYLQTGTGDELLGTRTTPNALFPGQVAELVLEPASSTGADKEDTFVARILTDPSNPTFHECREDNNESDPAKAQCSSVR